VNVDKADALREIAKITSSTTNDNIRVKDIEDQ
jgi:hypothetical protein